MNIRPATADDLPEIVRWRHDAAAWLAEQGSDQWSDAGISGDEFAHRVSQSINDGETWMAVADDGTPLGTIALDQWADPGLWSDGQLSRSLVIHRMIIDRSATRRGIGAVLLRHADRVAADRGLDWLVLDAWTTNIGLHDYYERHGFERVGTVPNFPSGALFQRRVRFHEHSVA